MKKFIIVLTKDERSELLSGSPTFYQKPICRTNKVYRSGEYFIMTLKLPDLSNPNVQIKEKQLLQVEKIVSNIYFVKIPNMEKIK